MYEKIVLVTRKTRLQQLVERFNSRGQARFYIEHAGGDFGDYQREDDAYARALDTVHRRLDLGVRLQLVEHVEGHHQTEVARVDAVLGLDLAHPVGDDLVAEEVDDRGVLVAPAERAAQPAVEVDRLVDVEARERQVERW